MDIFQKINWVDIVILIVMLRMTYVSFKAGFTHDIFPLFGNYIVVILSLKFYYVIGTIISQKSAYYLPKVMSDFFAYLLLILLVSFAFRFFNALLNNVLTMQWHPAIEKFGGLLVGVLRASLITHMVVVLIVLAPLPYFQKSVKEKSLTGTYFLGLGINLYGSASRFLPVTRIDTPPVTKEELLKSLVAERSLPNK